MYKRQAEAAIRVLEADDEGAGVPPDDAAQAALAAETKARIMAEYRRQLDVFNDSLGAQALASQVEQLEDRLRLKALRAQRLELYRLRREDLIGDIALREVLAELDITEATLGKVSN